MTFAICLKCWKSAFLQSINVLRRIQSYENVCRGYFLPLTQYSLQKYAYVSLGQSVRPCIIASEWEAVAPSPRNNHRRPTSINNCVTPSFLRSCVFVSVRNWFWTAIRFCVVLWSRNAIAKRATCFGSSAGSRAAPTTASQVIQQNTASRTVAAHLWSSETITLVQTSQTVPWLLYYVCARQVGHCRACVCRTTNGGAARYLHQQFLLHQRTDDG